MPFNNILRSNKLETTTKKINHSASFVVSNNCLDKCPKCGQNVCEHTSVADAINLQNSVSQDFSTYSSDSSLIKQLFNESSKHTSTSNNKLTNRISMGAINKLNESFFLSQFQKQHMKTCNQCMNQNTNQFMPCFNLRPLSCQVMIIDKETTDKLLKDFFDSQPNREAILDENQNEDKQEETVVVTNNETNNQSTNRSNNTSNDLPWHSSPKNELINTNSINNNNNNNVINNDDNLKGKEKKKKKISNFRLFSRTYTNSIKTDIKKSSPNKKAILRSSGLVNCLTSSTSSSSSSCEELRHKILINKKFKQQQQQQQNSDEKSKNHSNDTTDNDQTILFEEETSTTDRSNLTIKFQSNKNESKLSLCKSIMSLTSKTLEEEEEEEEDNNHYNEMQNIELCPIVVSDIDEFQENECLSTDSQKSLQTKTKTYKNKKPTTNTTNFTNCNNNYNSNNFNNNNIITNHNNTTNINNISTIISVPLNNYLFYNYEKRNNETQNNTNKEKNSSKILTETSPEKTSSSYGPIYQTKTETINSDMTRTPIRQQCYTANNSKKNRRDAPISKNRLSYFSSCSSTCVDESASTSGTFDEITHDLSDNHSNDDTNTSNNDEYYNQQHQHQIPYKYHSISIVFIIMSLFSINFFQEYFVMFYYFNTERFYWLIYSLIALFSGQTLTLILTLLTEIDYINSLNPGLNNKNAAVNAIYSPSSISSTTLPSGDKLSNLHENKQRLKSSPQSSSPQIRSQNNNQDLYLIFKNPFSKIFLLVPGFLPICVFVQFFKHLFSYRKHSGTQRFKLEFQLSLYLFYNCVFHSLPLAIINSCYFASTTTSFTLSSYYTDLLSLFSFGSSNYATPSPSSNSFVYIDDSNLERRNQLVLFMVSIFISISIGICLFTTYFELMKQMNYLSFIRIRTVFFQQLLMNSMQKSSNLGLIEILVYFCYKFCLITSRLSIIAIFWYMFHEWLILAVLAHLLLSYLSIFITTRKKTNKKTHTNTNESNENMLKNSTTESSSSTTSSGTCKKRIDFKMKDFDLCASDSSTISSRLENGLFIRNTKRSKLNKHLTLFIICLLSCIDLFMNQLSEIYHLKKVIFYYVIYFVQNFIVVTYWLIKSLMNARDQFEQNESYNQMNELKKSSQMAPITTTRSTSSFYILFKSLTTVTSASSSSSSFLSSSNKQNNYFETLTNFSPTQYACYATLIYLFIILFTIFGLILKFLHLHILRKRYRRLYN